MSKSNAWENALLQLVFNNVDAAGIGDASGLQNSATAGSLYVSLHTGDPGEAGSQTTNESAYGSYARVAVARTVGGWTVSGAFPECTSGTETITHFGVGTDSSGAGTLLYYAALTSSRSVSAGIQPQFATTSLTVTEA